MFGRLWSRTRAEAQIAHRLYGAIVTRAREPAFYRDFGVPDSVDGRFDLLVLHLFLAGEALANLGEQGAAVSQEMVDLFFRDMDRSLREMGAGDMGVPRRIKLMAQSFFGRAEAFRAGAKAGDRDALAAAIARNVFPDDDGVPAGAVALADYALAALAAGQRAESLFAGVIAFPDPAEFAPAAAS